MINFSDRKEITFDGKLFNLSDKSQKINGKKQSKLGKYFSAISLEDKYKALDNFLNHKMDIFNG